MAASNFGRRMSVEAYLKEVGASKLEVFPRNNKEGYYYFSTENSIGYVPRELGNKLKRGEKVGDLFIAEVTTEGHAEPMMMLCEASPRESIFTIPL